MRNSGYQAADGKTEYWAVLIGVDYTKVKGNINIIPFDKYVQCLRDTLVITDHWETGHVKVVTNENATLVNIIKALLWLDNMDDGDDYAIVYYGAHGAYLSFDFPPFDEQDRHDEYLTTYRTALFPHPVLTDDLFSFLLKRLDSKGVAIIIDACYGGGMVDNDPRLDFLQSRMLNEGNNESIRKIPFIQQIRLHLDTILSKTRVAKDSLSSPEKSASWVTGFTQQLNEDRRVVMAVCRENESGYRIGWRMLCPYLCEALQGYGDLDWDGVVSMEEAFAYAAPRYTEDLGHLCTPVMTDGYPGELVLTDIDFPPSRPPLSLTGGVVGALGTSFLFHVSSTDREGDRIRYGWNFTEDGRYFRFTYGDGVDAWSDYFNSGQTYSTELSWDMPGVYMIRAKAQDEHGAEIIPDFCFQGLWSIPRYILVDADPDHIDEFQLNTSSGMQGFHCDAQSFIPNISFLSKIKVKLGRDSGMKLNHPELFDLYPLNISIRETLDGQDLTRVSVNLLEELDEGDRWIDIDLPDIALTPGKPYFIVLSYGLNMTGDLYYWGGKMAQYGYDYQDEYPAGSAYYYDTENGWIEEEGDYSFVTFAFNEFP